MIRASIPALIVLLVVLAASEGRAQPDLILDDPSAEPFLWNGDYEYGEVRITNGARVIMRRTEGRVKVYASVTCTTFTLGEGSEIEGVGFGFDSEDLGGGSRPMDGSGGNGGSYGGLGGRPSMDYGGATYGTKGGLDIGPGGFGGIGDYVTTDRGAIVPGGSGGQGGAYIQILAEKCDISGVIRMDGEIAPRGFDCPPRDGCFGAPTGGGGGAGGGILILARELIISESAILSASGGRGGICGECNSRISGFGGGGGRIKLFYENGNISPDALFNVAAGIDGDYLAVYLPAQPGTVHIQQVRSIDDPLAPNADLNNDGQVDSADLLLLQAQWGVTDASAGE